jgi:hypothetical protein
LLKLSPDLLFLLLFVEFPLLFFDFNFLLIRSDDLILLQFKIFIDLLDASCEVLLKNLPLLSQVLVNLCLNQGVLMLRGNEGV